MNKHINKNKPALKPIVYKPCTNELQKMKKALDKLTPKYEQAQALGMKVKAKRIFKKALQVSKRISALLKQSGVRINVNK